MSDQPEDASANSLGLNFETLKIEEAQAPAASDSGDASAQPTDAPELEVSQADESTQKEPNSEDAIATQEAAPSSPQTAAAKEKKKQPYVNPDRVKTGGAQRDKLSEEELAERMARIREQNEKIKARREDVKKDEEEFKKTQEAERLKQAKNKKVQENVNKAREQNARRKMDKIQSREWDTGKPGVKPAESQRPSEGGNDANAPPPLSAKIGIRGGIRGGGRGGNFNRGRGRGMPVANAPREGSKAAEEAPGPGAQTEATEATVASS